MASKLSTSKGFVLPGSVADVSLLASAMVKCEEGIYCTVFSMASHPIPAFIESGIDLITYTIVFKIMICLLNSNTGSACDKRCLGILLISVSNPTQVGFFSRICSVSSFLSCNEDRMKIMLVLY